MVTPPPVSTVRPNNPLLTNDNEQTDDQNSISSSLLQSAERLLGPTHTSVSNERSPQDQTKNNIAASFNSSNPTFAVLKATALQQIIGHPMAYARALIQMGYEPLPAYRGKTLFGHETYFYPNVFQYLKYIYNIDGFTGLYRGFGCSLISKMVCWYTTTKVDEILGPVDPVSPNEQTKSTWDKCIKKTLREVRCQSWGILISHPFQVMAVRSMGQFIGREQIYSSINIFQNFREIYNREGIGGFFVGLIPRWVVEIATIIISNVIIHLLKSQLPSQTEMLPLYEYMGAFMAQTVTYPLSIVATVTAINRSGLRAGMLPIMPIYANWQDAYQQLSKAEQLKRGSSLFNRVAIGAIPNL